MYLCIKFYFILIGGETLYVVIWIYYNYEQSTVGF